jgi:tRNA pseudouridine55 synthase
LLRPLDMLVSAMPMVSLEADGSRRFGQGQTIAMPQLDVPGAVRVYAGARFLGVATVTADGNLVPKRLVAQVPVPVT